MQFHLIAVEVIKGGTSSVKRFTFTLRCHGNSDVNETFFTAIFHLYVVQSW